MARLRFHLVLKILVW